MSPEVRVSTRGAGNYLAMRYRLLSRAVKHTHVAGPNTLQDIHYLVGDRKGIRPLNQVKVPSRTQTSIRLSKSRSSMTSSDTETDYKPNIITIIIYY